MFTELNAIDVFEIMKLRQDVFIVEQECIYHDLDDLDKSVMHLRGYSSQNLSVPELCVYARIIAPGVKFKDAAIGRVVVKQDYRDRGFGVALMREALAVSAREFPKSAVRIAAQTQLENFYKSLGFIVVSEMYIEDEIPHVDMLKEPG